jgi:importin subunit beta-1
MIHWLNIEDFKPQGRFLAALLFKNTILNTTKENYLENMWRSLDDKLRSDLKYGTLLVLGSNNADARRGAAMCVSAIASIEIPLREWPEIIDQLASNIDHESLNIRNASL